MPTLEEQIEERKKEAANKNIGGKAAAVAEYLGQEKKFRHFQFGKNELEIDFQDSCGSGWSYSYGHVTITVSDSVVYDGSNSFIPGKWEITLNELYELSLKSPKLIKEKKEEKEKKEAEDALLRAKWGL